MDQLSLVLYSFVLFFSTGVLTKRGFERGWEEGDPKDCVGVGVLSAWPDRQSDVMADIRIYPRKVPHCTDRAPQPQHPQGLGNIEILTNFNMCINWRTTKPVRPVRRRL